MKSDNPFSVYFDLKNGLGTKEEPTRRYLSQMKGMYHDSETYDNIVKNDPLVYEFYDLGIQETQGDLSFGTSILYPGQVGDEYFMTKGHFHNIIDTAEVYYCVKGNGVMLMENPEGITDVQEFSPGKAVYVSKRFAHRSVNTGKEPLITFFVFRADAGHDYSTIETKGFRKLIVNMNGKPEIIENQKWH